MRKILGSGAEATVYKDKDTVDKVRLEKSYRHIDLDMALRRSRTKKEAKILKALEQYGFAPKILEQKDYDIKMSFIRGIQLKKLLDKNPELASLVGENLTIMHDMDIIHGDLTTSNMIFNDKLYFIDFGLSFNSSKIEDKAVDIHLFKQALESKHYKVSQKAYTEFLKKYTPKNKREILQRLSVVEQRGRYKEKT